MFDVLLLQENEVKRVVWQQIAMSETMWGVLWMVCLCLAGRVLADLPDQDCPDDCDCHYFRVNWVTDCSESNLTSIPTEQEGLSLNVYILNMNANNMRKLEPFPADLKVYIANNLSIINLVITCTFSLKFFWIMTNTSAFIVFILIPEIS